MLKYLKELIFLSLVILILDFIWIGLIMKTHYQKLVKEIQGEDIDFKPLPASLCYIVLIGGIYYFVVLGMKKSFDILNILSISIPFGLVVYGVYDLTSCTMLKKWDYLTTFLDILWGCFICTFSAIMVGLLRKLNGDEQIHIKNFNQNQNQKDNLDVNQNQDNSNQINL
jgi:uncharacterized membrane protein